MKKIAVLVCGQMRTLDQTYQQIKEIYKDADFYIHAVLDEDTKKGHLLKPKIFFSEPQFEMPEKVEYSWNLARGCHGVQRVLKQLWGLEKVWELYENSGDKHDIIIRWRPDTLFIENPEQSEEIEEELDNKIFIPKFFNYWGLNDRFAFGNYEVMKIYFNRFKKLDEFISIKGMFHPETFLAWSIISQKIDIRRTKAVFHTLRKDGSKIEPVYNPKELDILS